ncbi:hypothetical protein ACLOJK_001920 [Asimina triloba]
MGASHRSGDQSENSGKTPPISIQEHTDGGGIGAACVSRSRGRKTAAMAGHRSSTLPLSVSSVFVVVVVLFSSAAVVVEAAGAAQRRIPSPSPSPRALAICQRTDYPPLCVTYAIPAKWRRVTVAAMTRRSILSAITKTKQADVTAKKLLGTAPRGKDGMRKANLKWCDQAYRDALTNLVMSVKNVKAKDKTRLNINLSTALSDYTACNDAFVETPGGWAPLQSTNALLKKLVSNSLALAEMDK